MTRGKENQLNVVDVAGLEVLEAVDDVLVDGESDTVSIGASCADTSGHNAIEALRTKE
jgi:hypothetical protein